MSRRLVGIQGATSLEMLEFYFDCSSPWTYIGFHNLLTMAERHSFDITWRPILVGGVFNAVNAGVYEERSSPNPVKLRYYVASLRDWSRLAGLPEIRVPTFHPASAVKIMRGCTALLGSNLLTPFARTCFEAYFHREEDISRDEVLVDISGRSGVDPDWLRDQIQRETIKESLRARTQELIERGGFGTPTFFVGDNMYFGNDALPLVEAKLLNLI